MSEKPVACETGDLIQGAWFLEQVSGARDDLEPHRSAHASHRGLVEGDHRPVASANDEQRGRSNERKRVTGKIRSPATRYDRRDPLRPPGGGDQGRTSASARSEAADWQPGCLDFRIEPVRRASDPLGQKGDVEP